jgi:hypothetical protein
MARNNPPDLTSGKDHRLRRSRGATARDVTASNVTFPCRSSARPRRTWTLSRRRVATTSSKNVVRRNSGSTRVTDRSGLRIAITSPGNPAPEPRSHTEDPSPISSVTPAQLSRWRSHNRGTSRGPINPRTVATSASTAAYASAVGKASENTLRATAGAEGVAGSLNVSRETFTPEGPPRDVVVPLRRTRTSALPPLQRRERPCARTETWARGTRAPRSPAPAR